MVVELRVCALHGCENSVEVTRSEARRYCCVAHRKMARNQRRAIVSPPPLRPIESALPAVHAAPAAPEAKPEPVSRVTEFGSPLRLAAVEPETETDTDIDADQERTELVAANAGSVLARLPAPMRAHVRETFASAAWSAAQAQEAAPEQPWPPPRRRPGEIADAPSPEADRSVTSPGPNGGGEQSVPVGFGAVRGSDLSGLGERVPGGLLAATGWVRTRLWAVLVMVQTWSITGRDRSAAAIRPWRAAWADRGGTAEEPDERTADPRTAAQRTASGLGSARDRAAAGWGAMVGLVPVNLREAWIAALSSLASNRLRSFLTTIGIIAGVASVIVLVAMGDGMTKGFDDQWSRFATQITIAPITGPVATSKAPQKLTDADLKALKNPKATPHVATWSPAVSSNRVTVAAGQKKAGSQLYGISQNYLDLANRHVAAGTWFTDRQMIEADRKAVIGLQVVNDLWGSEADPATLIGQPIRVGHNSFEIQGVVASDGQNDNVVMVPLETARAFVIGNDGDKLNIIIAKSTDKSTLEQAKSEIYQVLYNQHHVRQSTDRDFNVTDFTSILEQQRQSIKFMSMFIVAIAAISLFVGGVGVANIMLVSVTERTREIGIRKAIGAPRSAIMRQFLSEAVMLTAMGGAVGVVLGIGMCKLGEWVIPEVWPPDPASLTPTPLPLLSLSPVLIAFGVSLVIGLLAGGYPAYRAARMRPIEALRHQ